MISAICSHACDVYVAFTHRYDVSCVDVPLVELHAVSHSPHTAGGGVWLYAHLSRHRPADRSGSAIVSALDWSFRCVHHHGQDGASAVHEKLCVRQVCSVGGRTREIATYMFPASAQLFQFKHRYFLRP